MKYTWVAIAYDFDGTLAKGNIQDNSFIPSIGMSKKKFWDTVKRLSRTEEMDEILAYMYVLITEAWRAEVQVDKKNFKRHGEKVKYFKGVRGYFNRIDKYAEKKNILLEHYIISSGTKEMIEGTSIAKQFEYIYASSFKYDHHGVAKWPALAINYTNKVQYLFRINKGIHNAWDNKKINQYTPENKRRIPFKNMIYIGDGLTDVPAMKMVRYKGGNAIGVYTPYARGGKKEVSKLLKQDRVNYVAAADYSKDSELVQIIEGILNQISARESIARYGLIPKTIVKKKNL